MHVGSTVPRTVSIRDRSTLGLTLSSVWTGEALMLSSEIMGGQLYSAINVLMMLTFMISVLVHMSGRGLEGMKIDDFCLRRAFSPFGHSATVPLQADLST